jgi:hypothetical protein
MANDYYKADTLLLYYVLAGVSVLSCVISQFLFFNYVPSGKDFEPFIGLCVFVTAVMSFICISLIFYNKGNTVLAAALILIVLVSLIWSLLNFSRGLAGIA